MDGCGKARSPILRRPNPNNNSYIPLFVSENHTYEPFDRIVHDKGFVGDVLQMDLYNSNTSLTPPFFFPQGRCLIIPSNYGGLYS